MINYPPFNINADPLFFDANLPDGYFELLSEAKNLLLAKLKESELNKLLTLAIDMEDSIGVLWVTESE